MSEFVLHVGTMKTGTTYIQSILSQNKDFLAENGWLYPGKRFNQQHACYGICGPNIYWVKKGGREFRAAGRSLIEETNTWSGNIVVSAEALSTLSESGIEAFLSRIRKPTRIVFTIRPLWMLIPSAWQQMIKSGHSVSFKRFLDDRLKARWDDSSAPLPLTYGYGRSILRWGQVSGVPVDVIESLPSKSRSSELWDTFQDLCGLPNVPVKEVPSVDENRSISRESAEILAQVNRLIKGNLNADHLRRVYLREVLFPLASRGVGSKTSIPPGYVDLINQWNDEEMALARKGAAQIRTLGDEAARHYKAGDVPANMNVREVMAQQIVAMLPRLQVGENEKRVP